MTTCKRHALKSLAVKVLGKRWKFELPDYPKGKPRGRPFKPGNDARRERMGEDGGMEDDNDNGDTHHNNGRDDKAATQLAALVRQLASSNVDMSQVEELVTMRMAEQSDNLRKWISDTLAQGGLAQTIRVEVASGDVVTVQTVQGLTHAALAIVLQRIAAGLRNVLLVGPAGSGKTTLGHQLAEALGVRFASVSCSAGMSEGVLLGRLLPTGDAGRFEYVIAQFVDMYENGGVFLLDEVDAADANVLLVLNSAIANGHLDVPNRLGNPVAMRHPKFFLIAAGNTWGMGANRQYVGRNQLDAAFLSRFAASVVEMPYDRKLEKAILDAMQAPASWSTRFWAIRERIDATGLRRIWGTREMVNGAKLLTQNMAISDVLDALTVGWTQDERDKAGI
jgi:MoxR-like ATPase